MEHGDGCDCSGHKDKAEFGEDFAEMLKHWDQTLEKILNEITRIVEGSEKLQNLNKEENGSENGKTEHK
jgi:hypothetical protein